MNEDVFLQSILDDPKDDSPRLIYADWLEEQDDPVSALKAEFLRLTAELAQPRLAGFRKVKASERLQELAAQLNTSWLAVVSRLTVENCPVKRQEAEARLASDTSSSSSFRPAGLMRFDFVCDRRWEDLLPTENRDARHCHTCQRDVHYCDTIIQARQHASSGHCIAVDVGVIRSDQDITRPVHETGMRMVMLGRPSAETVREAARQLAPDPVSATREGIKYLGLTDDLVVGRHFRFLPLWDRSVLSSIQNGILVVVALWSVPVRQAFQKFAQELAQVDLERRLELVVVDTDGAPSLAEVPELARRLRGNGETAWVRDGKVLHVTWLLANPGAFVANTRALLAEHPAEAATKKGRP